MAKTTKAQIAHTSRKLKDLVFLIDNVYVVFGNQDFQICVGNCMNTKKIDK